MIYPGSNGKMLARTQILTPRTLNTTRAALLVKRANRAAWYSSEARHRPDSELSNPEMDAVLLDKLFRKNKPSSTLFNKGSFLERHEKANRQQKDKFRALDENLLKLKSTPINFNYYLRNLKDLKNANQLPYKFGSNQLVSNDPAMSDFLKRILWEFNAPIRYAFGYGSKVLSQGDSVDVSNSQIDMIFAVSYPDHWHSLNINQFPEHYSALRHFGSNVVSSIGELGAGVYFNPFVKLRFSRSNVPSNFELKYGVTSVANLIHDLMNWETMYLSGRLHKPVAIIRNSPNISLLNQYNLTNAIKLSLLLLNKEEVTEYELFHQIAKLSYMGDPRTKVGGEDPYKVDNIVVNQFAHFREMYHPLLLNYLPSLVQQLSSSDSSNHTFKINMSAEAKAEILADLPLSFRKRLFSKYAAKFDSALAKDPFSRKLLYPGQDSAKLTPIKPSSELSFLDLQNLCETNPLTDIPVEDWEYLPNSYKVKHGSFVKEISRDESLVPALKSTVADTVRKPAMVQSLKGILTAGITSSWKYALEKRSKFNNGVNKNKLQN